MTIYKSGTLIANRYEVVQGPKEKPSLAGGMGLVYLCVDHDEDGNPVALKTFRPELLSNRAARDRFLREGTTWVELGKHPHIVHCYEVFKTQIGSEVFFALELVAAAEGKKDASLRSWLIPNKPLPLEQALLFALHICRGMVHATNKIPGIVHRDLKPENILIGRDGRARVTDFGLASAAQNLGSDWQLDGDKPSSYIRTQLTHGIAGTPFYMAPEQWAGEPLDERADIYAFGCILYEMLCGSMAVIGKSVEELREAHCQGRLRDIPSDLPKQIASFLQRYLAVNRKDRHQNWKELENKIIEVYQNISGTKVPEFREEVTDARGDRIAVGWSFNAIGHSYLDIGKFEMARNYFKQVLTIAHQENNCALEVASLGNLGIAYAQLGDMRQAIKFFENQLAIARNTGDRYAEGVAIGNLGNAYRHLGDPYRAIEFHKQNLSISRETGDRMGESLALGNLGIAFTDLGDPSQAIQFHERRLIIAREVGDQHGEGQALGNLGNAYYKLGDLQQAIMFYEMHLTLARNIGDRQGENTALGNLGTCYAKLGNTPRAIEFFKQHLIFARDLGDRHGECKALGNLGSAYDQLGDSYRAIDLLEQQLSIARDIGDRHGESSALCNLGIACRKLGKLRRAITFFEQSLAIDRETGDIMGVALTSSNMVSVLLNERPSEALEYANEALQIFNQIGNKQYADRVQALINKIKGC